MRHRIALTAALVVGAGTGGWAVRGNAPPPKADPLASCEALDAALFPEDEPRVTPGVRIQTETGRSIPNPWEVRLGDGNLLTFTCGNFE